MVCFPNRFALRSACPCKNKSRAGWYFRASQTIGSELVEFALVLPFLAVSVIAIADFGGGFALRDKLANAAREGARVIVSRTNDTTKPQCTGSTPCAVQSGATTMVNYLANTYVNTCGMSTTAAAAAGPGAVTWTYTSGTPSGCPTAWSIKIERAVPVVVSGTSVFCTRVTISYPFKWSFGKAVQLLLPASTYASTVTLQTQATMPNQN